MLEQHPLGLKKCEGASSPPGSLSFLRPPGGSQEATPTACTAQWGEVLRAVGAESSCWCWRVSLERVAGAAESCLPAGRAGFVFTLFL